ncbi:dimethylaniline monooxygenase [N-oxide-forming] 5-like protein [Leptotrombidium deliense]|uniref:Flavin-containing monooxygenase n=1 Tax=Leptotrombidium deliense TaxID=299467 RepID=A0A443S4R8_9ACAR|nr:dimethylaniline monooxygenase [N-oxide-forming] 5-like protein [Leptotrombidium deliense]
MLKCVIGAGAARLAANKQCLDQQLNVVCFEKTNDIGVMKSSRDMLSFSDFVPPDYFPIFMPNKYVFNYFELMQTNSI